MVDRALHHSMAIISGFAGTLTSRTRMASDTDALQLPSSLVVEIAGAKRDAAQDQRACCRERDRIEGRGRQRNDSILIRPRRPADITAATRRAKSPGKALETRRQFCIASR